MGESMTDEKMLEFREAFEMFDKDKDGYILVKDLAALMKALDIGPTDNEVSDIVNEVDIDGNGNIDFKEYIQLIARKMRDEDFEPELVEAFNLFDRDKNGLIGLEELKQIMGVITDYLCEVRITDEECQQMLDDADIDQDGNISYDEFKKKINKI